MKIYIAMICDRHTDPEPFPFSTAEAAIDYARQQAHEYARDEADIEEEDLDGWLYHATYSAEGDAVWVVEKVLDQPTAAPSTP